MWDKTIFIWLGLGYSLAFIMAIGHMIKREPTSMDQYAAGALFTLSVGLLNYHLILSNYYAIHPSQLGWLFLISGLHGVFVCDCFKTLKDSPPLSKIHYIGMLLLVLALYSPIFLQNNQATIAFLDSTDDSMDSLRSYIRAATALFYLVTFIYVIVPLRGIVYDWPAEYEDAPTRKIVFILVSSYSATTLILLMLSFVLNARWLINYIAALIPLFLIALYWINIRFPEFYQTLQKEIVSAQKYRNILEGIDKKILIDEFESFVIRKEVFLQQTLSLEKVAVQLCVSKNILSAVINDHFDANFNNIINSYRIEYAKSLLINKLSMPILDVCYESGFNSKSSFYKAFREHAGLNPSGFRSNHKNNNYTQSSSPKLDQV